MSISQKILSQYNSILEINTKEEIRELIDLFQKNLLNENISNNKLKSYYKS